MYCLDNYRYPYHATIYPPFCFCLGLAFIVTGLTISAFYQTVEHLTSFMIYSFICITIAAVVHLQYYTSYEPGLVADSDVAE
jgi:hypothetical protein